MAGLRLVRQVLKATEEEYYIVSEGGRSKSRKSQLPQHACISTTVRSLLRARGLDLLLRVPAFALLIFSAEKPIFKAVSLLAVLKTDHNKP